MKPFLVLLLAFLPLPAAAEDSLLARFRAPVDACYNAAQSTDDMAACNGLLSISCMEREEYGQSTHGMASCMRAEMQFWDEWLNHEYRATMAHLREVDAADRAMSPETAIRADRLRTAQRAWIAFRDADCAVTYALWGNGSMRLIMGPSCLSERTYERVLDLIQLREMMH